MNNIARGVLTLFLCMVLVGFGLCGAYGTFGGLAGLIKYHAVADASLLIVCGLIGLGIACGCGMAIARLWRKRRPADK